MAALTRVDGRCEACGTARLLHVHHRTYERFGQEHADDLSVLCEACHALVHDLHRKNGTALIAATDLVISLRGIKPGTRRVDTEWERIAALRKLVKAVRRERGIDEKEHLDGRLGHRPNWLPHEKRRPPKKG